MRRSLDCARNSQTSRPQHGVPDFYRETMERDLVYFSFDLLHRDGEDLRRSPIIERKRRLARLINRSNMPCLHLVQGFDDGVKLLAAAEQHGLEGIVSKRKDAPYRSGECRDWRKVKTTAWREGNRER